MSNIRDSLEPDPRGRDFRARIGAWTHHGDIDRQEQSQPGAGLAGGVMTALLTFSFKAPLRARSSIMWPRDR